MDRSTIDMIIEANNIVDVIGSYIPLKKAGTNFKARCPFHEEKTASFVVSEKKQIYKCFGCGKSGNVVSFLMDYDKLSFPDAMKRLAARVGMEWKEKPGNPQKKDRRDLIYKIYQLTTGYYKQNLNKFGNSIMDYLKQRQLSATTIAKFDIGYAMDGYTGLKNFLIKNHINDKIFESTGLFSKTSNGYIDIFRHRLIFPIHSSQGKVVAFGGRVIDAEQKGGKYINSPTTEIYTKGNELYGLHITRHEISRKKSAIVCEGYLDFLRLYESDFTNAVASLGTALTSSQINKLSRYTQHFFMMYDGDKAGRKAAVKAAGNILASGYIPRIVSLPQEEDPDSYLLKYGKDALQKKIDEAETLAIFVKHDTVMDLTKKEKIDVLLEIAAEVTHSISKELFLQEISDVFGMSINALYSSLPKTQKKNYNTPQKAQVVNLQQYQEERDLLKLILNDISILKKVANTLDSDYFLFEIYRKIYDLLIEFSEEVNLEHQLLNKIDDESLKNIIGQLMMEELTNSSFDEIIKAVKLRKYQVKLKELNEEIATSGSSLDLLTRKNELKKKIISLNGKIVNKTLFH